MQYASIRGDASHRQNKVFRESVSFWKEKNFPDDVAINLARLRSEALSLATNNTAVAITKQKPKERSNVKAEKRAKTATICSTPEARSPYLSESDTLDSELNSEPDNQYLKSVCHETKPITQQDIELEIARQKTLGTMTEIPPVELVSRAADLTSSEAYNISSTSRCENALSPLKSSESTSDHRPYWALAGLCCVWLVQSMTTALPGPWYLALPIAIAFEFGPMLIFGANIDKKSRKIADWGAFGIFILGLFLYLAPAAQVLWNEATTYIEASESYAVDSAEYRKASANTSALIETAKSNADEAKRAYENLLTTKGESSWKTVAAKGTADLKFKEWRELSSKSSVLKAPLAPKISNDLITAAQSIAIRVGLFAVIYFLMFVKRRI